MGRIKTGLIVRRRNGPNRPDAANSKSDTQGAFHWFFSHMRSADERNTQPARVSFGSLTALPKAPGVPQHSDSATE